MAELDPIRLDGFGGTDMGAVFGVDPYRDLHGLYVVKKLGVVMPPVPWRWRLGKYLEPAVMAIYSDSTEKKVETLFDKTFRHPRYPHVLATPDALVIGESRGVDAKVAAWDQRHKWGLTPDEIPDRVRLQIATYMEVMDRDAWDIALLSGDQFRVITIDRDREFGAWLMAEASRIWDRYFEGDERPPIGASEATSRWLQQAYPKHRSDIRPATDAEIKLLTEYGDLRVEQDKLRRARGKLENQIKAAIKEREGLEWPGGRFTWKLPKDSVWVDWESMAIALRTHYIKDEETRQAVTKEHTRTTAGVRRIYFKSDAVVGVEEAEDAA